MRLTLWQAILSPIRRNIRPLLTLGTKLLTYCYDTFSLARADFILYDSNILLLPAEHRYAQSKRANAPSTRLTGGTPCPKQTGKPSRIRAFKRIVNALTEEL